MKYSVSGLALAGLLSLVAADTLDDLIAAMPQCAKTCIDNGVSALTNCGLEDWTCACIPENLNVVSGSVEVLNYVIGACGDDGGTFETVAAVIEGTQAVCEEVYKEEAGASSTSTSVPTTTTSQPTATATLAPLESLIANVPQCAAQCVDDATTSLTSCAAKDWNCACIPDNFNAISGSIDTVNCVIEACGDDGGTFQTVTKVVYGTQVVCDYINSHEDTPRTTFASSTTTSASSSVPVETCTPTLTPDDAATISNLVAAIAACGVTCIEDGTASATDCDATDYACQCTAANQNAITSAASQCVIGACGFTVGAQVLGATSALYEYVIAHPAVPAADDCTVMTSPVDSGPSSTTSKAPVITTSKSGTTSTSESTPTVTNDIPPATSCSLAAVPSTASDAAIADLVAAIPACGTKCIEDGTASATDCDATDYACKCSASNQDAITSAAFNCVIDACGFTVGAQVQVAISELCKFVNEHPVASASSTTTCWIVTATPTGGDSPVTTSSAAGTSSSHVITTTLTHTNTSTCEDGSVTTLTYVETTTYCPESEITGKPTAGRGGNGRYSAHPTVSPEAPVAPTGGSGSGNGGIGGSGAGNGGAGSGGEGTGGVSVATQSTTGSSLAVFTGAATNLVVSFGSLAAMGLAVLAAL